MHYPIYRFNLRVISSVDSCCLRGTRMNTVSRFTLPITLPLCLFALAGFAAMSVPRGIPPHTNRYDYNATCFTESLAIAGTMVPPDQVRELFGLGFERQFLVVEVGFYSKNRAAFDVRPSDFALRAHPSRSAVKPA